MVSFNKLLITRILKLANKACVYTTILEQLLKVVVGYRTIWVLGSKNFFNNKKDQTQRRKKMLYFKLVLPILSQIWLRNLLKYLEKKLKL